jgi:hypothetical protein
MDSRSAIISLKNQANIKGTVRKDLWGLFFIFYLLYSTISTKRCLGGNFVKIPLWVLQKKLPEPK